MLKQANEFYVMKKGRKEIVIKIIDYNTRFHHNSKDVVDANKIVFDDFFEYKKLHHKGSFIDWMNYSIANCHYIEDSIVEKDFYVKDGLIHVDDTSFFYSARLKIDKVNVAYFGSYFYVEDTTTSKKYFYYAD